MKTLALTLAFALTSILGYAQDTEGTTITVTIENIKSNDGKVLLSLHTKDTFMKGPGVKNAESKIEDGKVVITFENVTPGEYAIMALHDKNENNKMDFQDSGMPAEDYGTSNNVMTFGPPQYDNSKFNVADKPVELNIKF
ncbi:DUF2141 domain-containing protein [Winogradskyella sp. 3972H.M.0a.05]|uniref:DUF2141 domain-containing protein n=1 Tax=Winogradskyella sp. 3972H.M.0a.05 TaxID=2950277 RepID=UPI0033929BC7